MLICNESDTVKVRQGTPVYTDKVVNGWEKLDARHCLSKRNHPRRTDEPPENVKAGYYWKAGRAPFNV
jgi:hypothetical protein